MNDEDPQTGITAFLHCAHCLQECPEGVSPAVYASLSVGVSHHGNLIVWCNRHEVQVANLPNDKIADELLIAAGTECDCCHKKETMH